MLLNSHDLDAIITIVHYAWQNGTPELIVSRYFFFGTGHSDVAFVNEQGFCIGHKFIHLELEGIFRIPNLSTEYFRMLVLNNSACPCRDALTRAAFPFHYQFVKLQVLHCRFGQLNFPNTIFKLSELIFFVFLPVVEITNQKNSRGIGCPLSENPAIGSMMKSKIQITRCEIGKTAFFARQPFFNRKIIVISSLYGCSIGFEPGIRCNYGQHF